MAKALKKREEVNTLPMSISDLEKKLGSQALVAAQEEPQSDVIFLSTAGKKFKTGDGNELKAPLRVVILGASYEHAWFDTPYNPKSADANKVPACWSVGGDEAALAPGDDVPKKQHENCASCPLNAFGSAENGSAKACSNYRRLAFILADDKSTDPQTGVIKVSPTGLKAYSKYVRNIAQVLGMPPHGVVTELDFKEDSEQPVLTFTYGNAKVTANAKLAGTMLRKRAELVEEGEDGVPVLKPNTCLTRGYDASRYVGTKAIKKGAKAVAKKKTKARKF